MEEVREQTMFERLFPQLAELAKSGKQLVLELPNFADTPLRLRHNWLFTDSLYVEDYKISLSGGKSSRSVLIWKGDKRRFMININLTRTSDYEYGRGAFGSIYSYFPGTERLPLFGFNDLEIQGNFHDATTLDDILQRLSRLAEVIKSSKVPPLNEPLFVDGKFRDDISFPD